jgi:Pentapeptide repeats (8 copies)
MHLMHASRRRGSRVYLIGADLIGTHLMGVHLIGVHLTGMYLIGVYGHVSYECI